MFSRSSNSTLSVGIFFSLTCLVIASTAGVDTNYRVQSNITGPGIPDTDRVNVSRLMLVGESVYEKIITFSYLLEADSGSYNCSAFVTSSQPYVIISDSTASSESVNVRCKL